jgi:putative membrane protein
VRVNEEAKERGKEMMWGGGMFFIWIFWIAIIVGGIWLAVYLLDPNHRRASRVESDPEEILRKRFARGEIDFEEFERRKRVLKTDDE